MKRGKNPRDAECGPVVDAAGSLAIHALAFLAQDEERVERFLRLTGLNPNDARGRLNDAAFQLAVLDHLAEDERLLLAFARAQSLSPAEIDNARRALGGGER